MKKLMVLDGNSILNRAFYGVRMLTASDGQPTNAVYGFLTILRRLLTAYEPDGLAVTFDRSAPTFRHRMYDGYKATRKGMPEELAAQLTPLREVLEALRIPCYSEEGWEADDLLGTISARCAEANTDCLLVTGDRDSLQLISEHTHVCLITTGKGGSRDTEYDPARFTEEYGFPPERLVDLKALMGDSSDNIPGVRGIGEKGAMELLHAFGSLEGVYAGMDSEAVRPALREKLRAGEDSARLSYILATIRSDAPLTFRPEDAERKEPDADALYRILNRLELKKLIEAYGLQPPADAPAVPACAGDVLWHTVSAEDPLPGFRADTRYAFACDPALSLLAVTDGSTGFFFPAPGTALLQAFFSPAIRKAGTNWKSLCRTLAELGIEAGGLEFDAALAGWLLDAGDGTYTLDRLSARYLGIALPPDTPLQPENLSPLSVSAEAEAAACRRAEAVYRLQEVCLPMLEEQDMLSLYREIELPLCPVLAEMERTGIAADRAALSRFADLLGSRIEELRTLIYELAGEEFNINSTKKLGEILFEKLGLPPLGKTKSGYSTSAEILEKLAGRHPVIEPILEYRKLTKLKSTYADGLQRFIGPDGRIRTTLHMTATATGRLSSADPNLQNIPIRTELGGELRKMFVPSPGCILVDADYSQIELRLLAALSGDEAMQEAFRSGEDIHRSTAALVFRTAPEEVTPLMRSRAKAVNFGIVYGISDYSLSQDIHVTRAEAKELIDSYFLHYNGIRSYLQDRIAEATDRGYAMTLFGRRRPLPELASKNHNLRSFGERAAMNMPVQGTAADIMKLAMVRVHRRLRAEVPKAHLLLQVHDELLAECPVEDAEQVMRILREEMEGAADLPVALSAEVHCGGSWYDAK